MTTKEVLRIKDRIRQVINEQGLHVCDIANEIDCDRKSIYRICGIQQGYTFGTKGVDLLKFLSEHNIDVNWILTGNRWWMS